MKGRCNLLVFAAAVSLISGCASAPKSTKSSPSAPALSIDQGRIWVYWPNKKWRPKDEFAVQANYNVAGMARQGSAFYVDKPPGNYLVDVTLMGRTKCYLRLPAGTTAYVRVTEVPRLSGRAYRLEEVSEAADLEELRQCEPIDKKSLVPGPKEESRLVEALHSPKESVVTDALGQLDRKYPDATNFWPQIKPLLRDPRLKVRCKAARVLGSMHADVNHDEIAALSSMLNSTQRGERGDALKSLRGLNASEAVPAIIPLLNNPEPKIIREACRTLAVLGDRSTIEFIMPLLQSSDVAVKADAEDAVFQLKSKPPDTRRVKQASL